MSLFSHILKQTIEKFSINILAMFYQDFHGDKVDGQTWDKKKTVKRIEPARFLVKLIWTNPAMNDLVV